MADATPIWSQGSEEVTNACAVMIFAKIYLVQNHAQTSYVIMRKIMLYIYTRWCITTDVQSGSGISTKTFHQDKHHLTGVCLFGPLYTCAFTPATDSSMGTQWGTCTFHTMYSTFSLTASVYITWGAILNKQTFSEWGCHLILNISLSILRVIYRYTRHCWGPADVLCNPISCMRDQWLDASWLTCTWIIVRW